MNQFSIPWKKTIATGIASVLVFLLIFKTLVGFNNFTATLQGVNYFYFWLAFSTMIPTFFLSALRWSYILKASELPAKYGRILMIVLSSASFSVIPGRLGDFARSYPLRSSHPVEKVVGTIFFEKIMDLCVLLAYAGTGLLLLGNIFLGIALLVLAISAIPAIMAINFFGEKHSIKNALVQKIESAWEILANAKEHKGYLLLAVLASSVNWWLSMAQAYLLFKSVHASVPFSMVIAYLPLSIFVGLLPITIAGLGTRDAALINLFKPVAEASQSLSVGVLYAFQSYLIPALICAPLLSYFFRKEN